MGGSSNGRALVLHTKDEGSTPSPPTNDGMKCLKQSERELNPTSIANWVALNRSRQSGFMVYSQMLSI
jgi:hypothetical protein